MLDVAFNFRESKSMKKILVGGYFSLVVSYAQKRIKLYIGELTHPVGDERLLYRW